MNKILVEVSVGELLDKISILEIKKEKIKDPAKLKFINAEHAILKDELDKNVKSDEKLNSLFKSLKEINAKLWVIEDDKRNRSSPTINRDYRSRAKVRPPTRNSPEMPIPSCCAYPGSG